MFLMPQAILDDMFHAAIKLDGALSPLNDETLRDDLRVLIRSIYVADVLASKWVVAIGGAQGAGKTTLVTRLCRLEADTTEWLPLRPGRGECSPVLLEPQAGLTSPQGWVQELVQDANGNFTRRSRQVDSATFCRATEGHIPTVLLPVLKLPPQNFPTSTADNVALLLLPGYERSNQENKVWQDLMRLALAGAGGCVLANSALSLASDSSKIIQNDLAPSGITPVVVVTLTDLKPKHDRQTLRETAADMFEHTRGRPDLVICTGEGEEFDPAWDRLATAIGEAGNSASKVRTLRVQNLSTLIRDLRKFCGRVERQLIELHLDYETQDDKIKNILAPYDAEVKKLRGKYRGELKKQLDSHVLKAQAAFLDIVRPDEGVGASFAGVIKTPSEKLKRAQERLRLAWNEPGDFRDCHVRALTVATFDRLGRGTPPTLPQATEKSALVRRIGYGDMPQDDLPAVSAKRQSNLEIFLTPGKQGELTRDWEQDIKMLPALALEFNRLAFLIAMDPRGEHKGDGSLLDQFSRTQQNFAELTKVANLLVVDIACMFGVEANNVHDLFQKLGARVSALKAAKKEDAIRPSQSTETVDSCEEASSAPVPSAAGAETTLLRLGGTALLAGEVSTLAMGAASLAAAAGIAAAIMMMVRGADQKQLREGTEALAALHDIYLTRWLGDFDEITNKVRDQIVETLRIAYNQHEAAFKYERLTRALTRLAALVEQLDDNLPPL